MFSNCKTFFFQEGAVLDRKPSTPKARGTNLYDSSPRVVALAFFDFVAIIIDGKAEKFYIPASLNRT
jgi:hypothetical protein